MTAGLYGTGVALATPLTSDYEVDYEGLRALVNHTIEGKAEYLVVQGTTGESPVFSWKQKLQILEYVIEITDGRVPIVFGHGGNDTYGLVAQVRELQNYPIDAILSVSPYYSRPSQKGIVKHYQLLADAAPLPLLLYNVPARTGANLTAATTLQLAQHPNIVGTKEASGDMRQCKELLEKRPEGFLVLSGDDGNALEMVKRGGEGIISVIANVIPDVFAKMIRYALDQHLEKALEIDSQIKEGYQLILREGNPSSIKAALEAADICSRVVKPPLYNASDELVSTWAEYLSMVKSLEL